MTCISDFCSEAFIFDERALLQKIHSTEDALFFKLSILLKPLGEGSTPTFFTVADM